MKYQIIITHVNYGTIAESEWREGAVGELDEVKDMIKHNLNEMEYLEIRDVIIPGELFRSSCVISFRTKE